MKKRFISMLTILAMLAVTVTGAMAIQAEEIHTPDYDMTETSLLADGEAIYDKAYNDGKVLLVIADDESNVRTVLYDGQTEYNEMSFSGYIAGLGNNAAISSLAVEYIGGKYIITGSYCFYDENDYEEQNDYIGFAFVTDGYSYNRLPLPEFHSGEVGWQQQLCVYEMGGQYVFTWNYNSNTTQTRVEETGDDDNGTKTEYGYLSYYTTPDFENFTRRTTPEMEISHESWGNASAGEDYLKYTYQACGVTGGALLFAKTTTGPLPVQHFDCGNEFVYTTDFVNYTDVETPDNGYEYFYLRCFANGTDIFVVQNQYNVTVDDRETYGPTTVYSFDGATKSFVEKAKLPAERNDTYWAILANCNKFFCQDDELDTIVFNLKSNDGLYTQFPVKQSLATMLDHDCPEGGTAMVLFESGKLLISKDDFESLKSFDIPKRLAEDYCGSIILGNKLILFSTGRTYTFDLNNLAYTMPFSDVNSDSWFYSAVKFAHDNSLFNGISETEFAPNTQMNRAMLVSVLYRMEGSPAVDANANPFADVKAGKYYTNAVIWAAQKGIVNGVSADTFNPTSSITREQMAAILYRYADYKGINVSSSAELYTFPDADKISDYAVLPMSWAVAKGYITGIAIGNEIFLSPKTGATRAQVATILTRFLG